MVGFEPRISGDGGDPTTNCATVPQLKDYYYREMAYKYKTRQRPMQRKKATPKPLPMRMAVISASLKSYKFILAFKSSAMIRSFSFVTSDESVSIILPTAQHCQS